MQMSIRELNKHLQAPVTISSADFTFFDNFPHASIHLRNVVVRSAHPESFDTDTLLRANSVFLVFNPLKFIQRDYTISACHAEQGYLTLRTTREGVNNFDIITPSATTDTSQTTLRLQVNRFRLSQMACTYVSEESQLSVDVFISSLAASLKLDGAHQQLSLRSEGLVNLFKQKEFIYAQREPFAIETAVLRDGERYEVQSGIVSIDQSRLAINGRYDAESMHLSLRAESSSLNLMSVFAFTSQYKLDLPPQLRIRGAISASLAIEGSLRRGGALSIGLNVNGEKLACSYGSTKFAIQRFAAEFSNGDKCNLSTSSLNISACELASAKSTAILQLYLTNLASPTIYAKWDVALVDSDPVPAQWSKYAVRYDALHTSGEYVATFPSFDSLSLRQAIRPKLRLEADASNVEARLSDRIALTNTDLAFTVVDYDISKGTLRTLLNGQPVELAFSAHDLLRPPGNLSQWTLSASLDGFDFDSAPGLPPPRKDSDSCAEGGFSLWKYVQSASGELAINRSRWRCASLDSVRARFTARKGTLNCRINNAAVFGGTTRGLVILSQRADGSRLLSATLDERQLDIKQLFEGLDNFKQSVLRSENLEGKLSGRFTLQVPFYSNHFDINALQAQATVTIVDGALINVQPLAHLSRFIALDELMNLRFATLQNTITLRNGRVSIPNMQINSSVLGLSASGEHHLNGRYLYRVKVGLGDILFNRLRARKRSIEENAIAADDDHAKMWLFLLIEGDSSSAYVRYDTEALGDYIQERVALEKASLQEAWHETYGHPNTDSARRPRQSKQKNTPILWQDDPAAPQTAPPDTVKKRAKPVPPPKNLPPIIWEE